METIKSFTVDHKRLLPGVYVSRKDSTGHDVATSSTRNGGADNVALSCRMVLSSRRVSHET